MTSDRSGHGASADADGSLIHDHRQVDLEDAIGRVMRQQGRQNDAIETPEALTAVKGELFARCEQRGGVRAFARSAGISPSLISETLSDARPVGEAVLNALGYGRRLTIFRLGASVRG
jgi:hypothetical protein